MGRTGMTASCVSMSSVCSFVPTILYDAQHSGHFGRRGFPGPSCPFEVGQAASPSGSPDPSPHRSLEVWGTKTLVLPDAHSCSHTSAQARTHTHLLPGRERPPRLPLQVSNMGPTETKTSRSEPGAPGPDCWRSRAGVALEARTSGSRPSDPSSRGARRSGPPPSPESTARPRSTRKPTRK